MSKKAATAEAARLPADTPPSKNPDFKGATAHDLARALLRPRTPKREGNSNGKGGGE